MNSSRGSGTLKTEGFYWLVLEHCMQGLSFIRHDCHLRSSILCNDINVNVNVDFAPLLDPYHSFPILAEALIVLYHA